MPNSWRRRLLRVTDHDSCDLPPQLEALMLLNTGSWKTREGRGPQFSGPTLQVSHSQASVRAGSLVQQAVLMLLQVLHPSFKAANYLPS